MKAILLLFLILLCACAVTAAQPQRWHVPTYEGMTLGKSTRADIERAFGKPIWSGPPIYEEPEGEVKDEILYEYENVGGFYGRTSVYLDVRSGVIKAITLYPNYQRPITLEEAIKLYGGGYIERESGLGPCPTSKELRNYKQKQEREYPVSLIYPHKGMYVSVDRDNKVNHICYLARCPHR
jgi:hypothetical protein